MSQYFGLKLRTGETIFCEVLDFKESPEREYIIKDPLKFEQNQGKDGTLSLSFLPYALYAAENTHHIFADEIFMADKLSKKFAIMYGEALMNFEISYLKMDTYEFLSGNISEDYVHLVTMVDRCKSIGKKYAERFEGVKQPDFSELEEKLLENRPSIN